MLTNKVKILCRFLNTPFFSQHFFASKFVSPFSENEVHNSHHENSYARDGPLLMQGNIADYLIIGGGVMGQSLAYNLWRQIEQATPLKAYKNVGSNTIAIVEKDPTLHDSSTALSVGGIRTQFSHSANVKLSLGSAEFIRNITKNLSTVRNPDPDVQLNHQGYLMMATHKSAQHLMENYNLQVSAGAKVMLLTKERLKETFPWLKVDDIELATYGLENEGWFDPMSLVNAFKFKNSSFPIVNITGEVVGIRREILNKPQPMETDDGRFLEVKEKVDGVYIKMKEHDKPVFVRCLNIFNCAGPDSGKIALMAGVGSEEHKDDPILKHKLPVERRKRYVYVVHCPDAPLLDLPFVVDPSGFYIRREGFGGKYVCGMSPTEDQEPSTENLDVDYDFFEDIIWPRLAERIPAFENLKVVSAWAGYYDYNTFDQNAIIGPHTYYHNFYFLTGFSGHGIQQSCMAGEQLASSLLSNLSDKELRDLDSYSFSRIIDNRPIVEHNII